MKKVLFALAVSSLAACVVGEDVGGGGGGGGGGGDDVGSGSGDPDPNPDPGDGSLKGNITENATWSGIVKISGALTIDAGVTVIVAAGTKVEIAPTARINVKGTLDVQGVKGNIVTLGSETATGRWGGVSVDGTYKLAYGKQTGGAIYTTTASITTISDSELNTVGGDFIVMNGGALDMQYSNLGLETGDTTHCNLHLNTATSIKFTHNNNAGAPFGLMFYAGVPSDFKHNNWITTRPMVDVEPGNTGTADFSESYFSGGQPVGTMGFTYGALSATKLVDVGPR